MALGGDDNKRKGHTLEIDVSCMRRNGLKRMKGLQNLQLLLSVFGRSFAATARPD